jgi:glutamate dehydrogenase/leucine dehydrogenase
MDTAETSSRDLAEEGTDRRHASSAHSERDAAQCQRCVPDYLANAGGVIDFHQEVIDD